MADELIATSLNPSGIVGEADLERELALIRAGVDESPAGVFGPGSMMWRIDREAAIFLGAGRALLLQRHAGISGRLTVALGPFAAGSRYQANDAAALSWVHATLIDTALIAYELVCPPLAAAERERYWGEARLFAAFFGIPQDTLPHSWAEFSAGNARMWGTDVLTVGEQARKIAGAVLSGAGTWLPIPSWYRALTARLLPTRLREEFGLLYGGADQSKTERSLAVMRRMYPRLPRRLRHVGPYQEACARLAGVMRPGVTTRLSNRLWIGQKSMAG